MKAYPTDTRNRQIQIKSNMKPYPTDTNQITIKTLNQSNTIERESLLVIDMEPLRTRTQIPTSETTQNTKMTV